MLLRQSDSCSIGQAPAKVNLFLRVVRRRADGYHDLETVMVRVGLADTLVFEPTADDEIRLTVLLAYPRSLAASPVPETPDNLVVKAARLLQTRAAVPVGARITLIKRTPAAAGLGGGSSDAACTLAVLNHLWRVGLSPAELQQLAAELGSDVPFFLADSAAAFCTGRGETLSPLTPRISVPLVIARPHTGLGTAAVFRACQPEPEGTPAGPLLVALQQGSVRGVAHGLQNTLQAPAERLNAEVGSLRAAFARLPVRGHHMTGSGTACFGICMHQRQARRIAARLRATGVPWVVSTSTLI
jgi:4-diphosphocytidyl-2-C-methyl-D-erythritol kinase